MTRLRLEIDYERISMDSFLKVMKEIHELLGELDCAVSRNRSGTLDWVISDLKAGSAYVEIESQVVRGDEDFARQVAQAFTNGLSQIVEEAVIPPFFTVGSVRRVLRIVRNLENTGNKGLTVQSPDTEHWGRGAARLTRADEPILRELVSVRHSDIGAIEGTLELVSYRPRSFNVFDSISRKVVKCDLPEELEHLVKENLGEIVEVSGVVSFNAQAEPLSIAVEGIRALGETDELPSIQDILGIAPDITGDLSTEEFIRVIRSV